MLSETRVSRQRYWLQPELCDLTVAPHVNMNGLFAVRTKEDKPIRADFENTRHVGGKTQIENRSLSSTDESSRSLFLAEKAVRKSANSAIVRARGYQANRSELSFCFAESSHGSRATLSQREKGWRREVFLTFNRLAVDLNPI